jgi:hypothetical protein
MLFSFNIFSYYNLPPSNQVIINENKIVCNNGAIVSKINQSIKLANDALNNYYLTLVNNNYEYLVLNNVFYYFTAPQSTNIFMRWRDYNSYLVLYFFTPYFQVLYVDENGNTRSNGSLYLGKIAIQHSTNNCKIF